MNDSRTYTIQFLSKTSGTYHNQIAALNAKIFPITESNSDQEREEFCSQSDKYGRIVALFEKDRVIGKVSMYIRSIVWENQHILLGGIGGVCTHLDVRKQGIATLMIKNATKILQKNACDIVFLSANLHSPWKIHMYESFGFHLLPHGYRFVGKSGKDNVRMDGLIFPCNSTTLFNHILQSPKALYIGKGRW